MHFEIGERTRKLSQSTGDFVEQLYIFLNLYSVRFSDTDCGYQTLPVFEQSMLSVNHSHH